MNESFYKLGKRIYYLKNSGQVIMDTGDIVSSLPITIRTKEEDFSIYTELAKYDYEEVDFIDLDFGEYAKEFVDCISYRINPETETLEFLFNN